MDSDPQILAPHGRLDDVEPLSVVVVSDFEATAEKTWADEVKMAQALARQDIDLPFRVIFGESEAHHNSPPPAALFEAVPHAEIVYAPSEMSAEMKDYAVRQCRSTWIAVFEADALPEPDWLRQLYDQAQRHPDIAVFSGRTFYGEETMWRRALGLIDRSYDDAGAPGESVHISNNGALYRADVLKAFPYPDAATPFLSSRRRNKKILAAGHKCYSERAARTRHAVGGLSFLWDVHQHTGYSAMMMRAKPGWLAIPRVLGGQFAADLRNAARVGPRYLRARDWPLWFGLLFAARVPEIWGMLKAARGAHRFDGSAYR